MNDCIFCKIANGSIPTNTILENESFIAFLDLDPYGKGHTIVIPKQHYENFFDIPKNKMAEYFGFIQDVAKKLCKGLNCNSINLLNASGKYAQGSISHVHFHIVPRFEDDGMDMEPTKARVWKGQIKDVLKEIND